MPISVDVSNLADKVKATVMQRLQGHDFSQVLVAQAHRRMDNGGDSQHKYPDLWATKNNLGYRAEGQPLLDNRQMYAGLNGKQNTVEHGVRLTLQGPLIAVYHQHGFKTSGPNFIALTLKARRTHKKGNDPKEEGLVEGRFTKDGFQPPDADYFMAWKGVTVPQRKIFNMPPENVEEIRDEVARALSKN